MSAPEETLFQPVDEAARALAGRLIAEARQGALGVMLGGRPFVTRVAVATDDAGMPVTLISDLAPHTDALRRDPDASLLIGEWPGKGDPLAFPRLTLDVTAEFVARDASGHGALRDRYLACQPKSRLYIDFGDFHLVRLRPGGGLLNGGFGKAFRLTAADLAP